MRACAVLGALALCACSEPRAPAKHAVRVVASEGSIEPALDAHTTLPLTATLAANAKLTLAPDDDVQITLRGPGRFSLQERALHLGAGLASIDVAAGAARAGRAPFVIATPEVALEVPAAARVVVRTREVSELAVVSGQAADARQAWTAGMHACIGAEVTPRQGSFATVESALDAMQASAACRDAKADHASIAPALKAELDALDRVAAEEKRLLADPAHAREALVTLAQQALSARTAAMGLRARLSALQLTRPARGSATLLARARSLEGPTR